jgi:hypothetical protein
MPDSIFNMQPWSRFSRANALPLGCHTCNQSFSTQVRQFPVGSGPGAAQAGDGMRFSRWIIACLLVVLPLWNSHSLIAQQDETPAARLARLVKQLDSPRFAARTQAIDEIVEFRTLAFRALAEACISGSSEAKYRAVEALEVIALSGDESEFAKAVAILKLICEPNSLRGRLDSLRERWMEAQTELAIQELQAAGARVEVNDATQVYEVFEQSDRPVSRLTPRTNLDREEVFTQLDRVLVGATLNNLEYAFGDLKDSETAEEPSTFDPVFNQQRNGPVIVNVFPGDIYPNFNVEQTKVTFGSDWVGDQRAFERLLQVKHVTSVEFEDVDVNADQIKVLAQIPGLFGLQLRNVPLDENVLEELRNLSGLQNIALEGSKTIAAAGEFLENLKSAQMLELDFDDPGVSPPIDFSRFQGVNVLRLRNTRLEQQQFWQIQSLRGLTQLRISQCPFKIEELNQFRERQTFDVYPESTAFLGVRGPTDFGEPALSSYRIEEVIGGTGAERAGLLVGDTVKTIDGQLVQQFEDLRLLVSQYPPGKAIEMTIDRNGEELTVRPVLGERDAELMLFPR